MTNERSCFARHVVYDAVGQEQVVLDLEVVVVEAAERVLVLEAVREVAEDAS